MNALIVFGILFLLGGVVLFPSAIKCFQGWLDATDLVGGIVIILIACGFFGLSIYMFVEAAG